MKINDTATAGIPDILGCVGRYFFALELKTQSKLSELQYVTLNKIDRCGAESFVVTPENWNEIFIYIAQYGKQGRERKPARFPLWTLPRGHKKKS